MWSWRDRQSRSDLFIGALAFLGFFDINLGMSQTINRSARSFHLLGVEPRPISERPLVARMLRGTRCCAFVGCVAVARECTVVPSPHEAAEVLVRVGGCELVEVFASFDLEPISKLAGF